MWYFHENSIEGNIKSWRRKIKRYKQNKWHHSHMQAEKGPRIHGKMKSRRVNQMGRLYDLYHEVSLRRIFLVGTSCGWRGDVITGILPRYRTAGTWPVDREAGWGGHEVIAAHNRLRTSFIRTATLHHRSNLLYLPSEENTYPFLFLAYCSNKLHRFHPDSSFSVPLCAHHLKGECLILYHHIGLQRMEVVFSLQLIPPHTVPAHRHRLLSSTYILLKGSFNKALRWLLCRPTRGSLGGGLQHPKQLLYC